MSASDHSATFYHPAALIAGQTVAISSEESHHALTVLRLKKGDVVRLFDGQGGSATGVFVYTQKKAALVEIRESYNEALGPLARLTLAVAPPKSSRQAVLVEKCTELGLGRMLPLVTERGVVQPTSALVERWRRKVIEACKQCGRAWVSEIASPAGLHDVLSRLGPEEHVAIAHRGAGAIPLAAWSRDAAGSPTTILIGPEGGWSPGELRQAAAARCPSVLLGEATLRVETAAIAAAAWYCILNAPRSGD